MNDTTERYLLINSILEPWHSDVFLFLPNVKRKWEQFAARGCQLDELVRLEEKERLFSAIHTSELSARENF